MSRSRLAYIFRGSKSNENFFDSRVDYRFSFLCTWLVIVSFYNVEFHFQYVPSTRLQPTSLILVTTITIVRYSIVFRNTRNCSVENRKYLRAITRTNRDLIRRSPRGHRVPPNVIFVPLRNYNRPMFARFRLRLVFTSTEVCAAPSVRLNTPGSLNRPPSVPKPISIMESSKNPRVL